MKNLLILTIFLVTGTCVFAQPGNNNPEIITPVDKAMLDGKTYVVTLTENTSGTGEKTALDNDRRMDNTVMKPESKPSQAEQKSTVQGTGNNTSVSGKKMLLRFENGIVKSSLKGEMRIEKCPYKSWGIESTGISFSADCNIAENSTKNDASSAVKTPASGAEDKNNSGIKSTIITGTVNGDTIHGTMNCTKTDGSVKIYSYTGSTAGKNDLDMESEMGMK